MSEMALRIAALRKRYGKRTALDGLDLEVPRGSICGFIGPNGAGKTTTFGIVAGLLQADSGEVNVLGRGRFDPERDTGMLGVLPQDSEIPPHARVGEWLTHMARLQGMNRATARQETQRVLKAMALEDRTRSALKTLSHGMRRRVAVGQALLGNPRLVLLDEPTSGLDPHRVAEMRDLLAAQRDTRDTTLLVSSHVLSDLEAICDHAVWIESGRCVGQGSLDQLTRRGQRIRVRLDREPDLGPLRRELSALVLRWEQDWLWAEQASGEAPRLEPAGLSALLLPALLSRDLGVLELRQGESLEQAYLSGRGAALESTPTGAATNAPE